MSGPKHRGGYEYMKLGTSGRSNPTPINFYTRYDESLLLSRGNPKRNGKYVTGGAFLVKKEHTLIQPSSVQSQGGYGDNQQISKHVPSGLGYTTPPPMPSTNDAKSFYTAFAASGAGTDGWKKARPGNPTASVAQFLVELRDLPSWPLRAMRRLTFFRGLGSEYLNVQFGWIPFVSDLKKMYETHQNLNKQLDQLVRDNGKGIRRRRSLGSSTTTTVTQEFSTSASTYVYPGFFYIGNSNRTTIVSTTEEKSFVGKFRYYVPDIGSDQWTKRATRALYGLNPTPEVLWEVLPWSWLIDWYANVGSVMSNLSANAVGYPVAEYAYVMSHKTITTSRDVTGSWVSLVDNKSRPFSCSGQTVIEYKARCPATPYGFGVKFDDLSQSQLAILAALGMSRSRF